MNASFAVYALFSFIGSLFLTWCVRRIALAFHVVDVPTGGRKIHVTPIPLLGGVAILLTFFIAVFVADALHDTLSFLSFSRLMGVVVASAVIATVGILDDMLNVSAWAQFVALLVAAILAAFSGIGVSAVTNPFGGVVHLGAYIGGVVTFVWVAMLSLTTKLLDGLDGLVTGVATIGALVIGIFSLFTKYYQPDIALVAFILAGSCAGFLVWNMHPAKIFLGNVGSIWLGFILGVLAVIAGGKLAIALLVLGVPLIDMVIVILRRIYEGRPPWQGDASHLHFKLLAQGWSQRKVVYVYWAVSAFFGGLTVVLQSKGKALAMLALVLLTLLLIMRGTRTTPKRNS